MGRERERIKIREETGREKEQRGKTWKIWACGAGETAQRLKALATLAEDPASIPSTDAEWLYFQLQGILHPLLTSVSTRTHTETQTNKRGLKINVFKKKEKRLGL